jgi:chromosomal replication initiation ATPase DnaA
MAPCANRHGTGLKLLGIAAATPIISFPQAQVSSGSVDVAATLGCTFGNFIPAPSNRAALAAVRALVGRERERQTPLVLRGGSG